MTIDELRLEIDSIDEQIVALYKKRVKVTDEIGRIKRESGKQAFDPEREKKIREKLTVQGGEDAPDILELYRAIMDISKKRQNRILRRTELPKIKIGIVGLGLIGGSLAKALRKYSETEIYGVNRNPEVVKSAIEDGTLTDGLKPEELGICDVVFIALPPALCSEFYLSHESVFKSGAIVCDLSGVKEKVVSKILEEKTRKDIHYVSAHTMAGREVSGYNSALPDLYENASVIIISGTAEKQATDSVEKIMRAVGASTVIYKTAVEHDRVIAFTSQLAHVVSNAYVKSPTVKNRKGMSAGSYEDMTRVARIDPVLWTELFFSNKSALTAEIETLESHIAEYKNALDSNDRELMLSLLKDGRNKKLEDL